MTGIKAIAELFAGPGARDYLGEPVTIGVHMRQAGALAKAAGAPAALVAAALLHGVGHLRDEPQIGLAWPPSPGNADRRHAEAGARCLGRWFPSSAVETGLDRRSWDKPQVRAAAHSPC
jgi:gamma-butyrobetaine dioxygenase